MSRGTFRSTFSFVASCLAIGLLGFGCGQGPLGISWKSDSESASSKGADALNNMYRDQAEGILSRNCTGCHGETSGRGGVYGFNDLGHLVSTQLIVPGHPENSLLFAEVSTGQMPPGLPLSADEISTLKRWISETSSSSGPAPTTQPPTGTEPSPTPTPDPTPTPGPTVVSTFESLNANVFVPKCVACHSASNLSGARAYDTYASVLSSVNTANPSSSELYQTITGGRMPRGSFSPVTSDEVAALLAWIQSGAPNN